VDEGTGNRRTEKFGWTDWLQQPWLKLPLPILQDVGPAVQTFGAILRVTNKETFVPLSDIAKAGRLPLATVKKHLSKLHDYGWIDRLGRGRTRTGVLRRTATIKLTESALVSIKTGGYGTLPWWATCRIYGVGHLPWSARAVLALVMSRLMMLTAVVEEQDGNGTCADDLTGSIDNLGGDDRFRFSLAYLQEKTGLSRESAVDGKLWLNRAKIIRRQVCRAEDGGRESDLLVPNMEFHIMQVPAPQGGVFLRFAW
jgi:hypothetical protein